jgi:hypothetical protein
MSAGYTPASTGLYTSETMLLHVRSPCARGASAVPLEGTHASWNKVVVVAREDEDAAMLNHAFIQSRRRYRT